MNPLDINKNKLSIKPRPISPRKTTLNSNNNVLSPNKLKTSLLGVDKLKKEERIKRANNISSGMGSFKSGWINKNK